MKKHRATLAVFLFLMVAFAGFTFFKWWTEPRFEGKRLSHWFQEFCGGTSPSTTVTFPLMITSGRLELHSDAEEHAPLRALRKIGPPAANYLVSRIASDAFGTRSIYNRVYPKLPRSLQPSLPNPQMRDFQRIQAAVALAQINLPERDRALPVIVELILQQPPPPAKGVSGISIPIALLPAFSPPPATIERLVTSLFEAGRFADIHNVISFCPAHTPVIASRLGQILDLPGGTNEWVFRNLRACGSNAVDVLPILLRQLSATNREVRYQAARTIEAIGPAAAAALPALTNSLADENPLVQSASRRALRALQGNPDRSDRSIW